MASDGHGERGQATALMVGVVALAVVVLLALVPLTRGVGDRARAQTAADAAALAGAAAGERAARDMAERNGGVLVRFRSTVQAVWVEVTVGEVRAVAKAQRD